MRSAPRRVVVTGIGPVTPIGTGLEDFWTGLITGRNGIAPISRFDTTDHSVKLAGEVRDFDVSEWLDTKEARRTDRFVHYAMASAKLAWENAGTPEVVSDRGGIVFATGIGGIEWLLNQHSVLLMRAFWTILPASIAAPSAPAQAIQTAVRAQPAPSPRPAAPEASATWR